MFSLPQRRPVALCWVLFEVRDTVWLVSCSPNFNSYDKAMVFEPHQHFEGVEHVFVKGVARVTDWKIMHALPGRVVVRNHNRERPGDAVGLSPIR